jgi:hypothetical protein
MSIPASQIPDLVYRPLSWRALGGIFLLALAVAFAALLTWRHQGPWFASAEARRTIDGTKLTPVRADARVTADGMAFSPPPAGAFVAATASFAAIDAAALVRVRIDTTGLPDGLVAEFAWHTTDGAQLTHEMQRSGDALLLDFATAPRWKGRIQGVGVLLRGDFKTPVTVTRLTLLPNSLFETARRLIREWFGFEAWHGGSINFYAGGPIAEYGSLTVLCMLTAGFALVLLGAFTRGWGRIATPWHGLALVLLAWVLLDLRWQVNLVRQVVTTHGLFAGKSDAERRRVDDREFFDFIQAAHAEIKPPGARVFMYSDDEYFRLKGAYLLRPRNVIALPREPSMYGPGSHRRGDFLVVFAKRGVRYARESRELLYGDAQRLPAEMVYFNAGNGVFKVL